MSATPVQKGLMGLLAALMIGGMAYQFMPAMQGGHGGGLFQQQNTPALKVNGEVISVQDLDSIRRNVPVLSSIETGVLADDFKLFILSQQLLQTLSIQGAKDINVSREEVAAEVKKIRDSQNLQDNKAWTDFLQHRGLSDSEARKLLRDQLATTRKVEALRSSTSKPTEAELQNLYTLTRENYKTDPQIVARAIVVADEKVARSLLTQAKGGTNFAALASENSLENKERGGALAPLENGQPKPVAGVVLPNEVAAAALALTNGGITDVINSGGKYYIVKVEKYIKPRIKTFDEAKSALTTQLSQYKSAEAVEKWLDDLKKNAQIEYVDPAWKIENPVVASVSGQNILYSELVDRVVNNHQVTAMLQQMPPEQITGLINSSLKPSILEQLIQLYAAPIIAKNLNLNLVGNREQILQQLALYAGKDILVSDSEVKESYQKQKESFKIPASAEIDEAVFKTKEQAASFRADWKGKDFISSATKAGATVSERGKITEGDGKVTDLEAAIFNGNLKPIGEGSLTTIVNGNGYKVAYVKDLQLATTRSLAEVEESIRNQLLDSKRGEAIAAFLKKQVAALKPTDNLSKVLEDQAKRVAAAEPAQPKTEEGQSDKTEPAEVKDSAKDNSDASTKADDTNHEADHKDNEGNEGNDNHRRQRKSH